MSEPTQDEEINPGEVAQYVAEMAQELARLSREAGLITVAAGLEQSGRAAMAEARAYQSDGANAAAEDAT